MLSPVVRSGWIAGLLAGCLSGFLSEPVEAQDNWPQFRGAEFNPALENPALPDHWSTTENVEWSTPVAGRGWSSPVVVNDRIYLTTVVTAGKSKPPQVGTEYSNEYVKELTDQGLSEEEIKEKVTQRDIELPAEVTLEYYLVCLDLNSGKTLWKKQFFAGHPPGGRHRKNSYSSETPTTDGTSVFVYVANLGLYAFDLDGTSKWKKELSAYPIYLDFGTGSSPVLHEGRLIIVNDNETESFITAYDSQTGEELWRTPRAVSDQAPAGLPKSGWVTPYIWKNKLRTEIVTMQPGTAISYDLDGKELWRLGGCSVGPAASSFAYGDLLYLNGGRQRPFFAMLPGATGDITPPRSAPAASQPGAEESSAGDQADSNSTAAKPVGDPAEVAGAETEPSWITWTRPRTGTYIPTPVAYQEGLYIVQDNGILSRLDTATGNQTFKTRLKTAGADFTSSPWAYNGKVFCLSEQGDTYVVQAGEEFNLLHVNALDEFVMASPAIVGDRLLIRTESKLYSIRQQRP